jgi:hypothetical protein
MFYSTGSRSLPKSGELFSFVADKVAKLARGKLFKSSPIFEGRLRYYSQISVQGPVLQNVIGVNFLTLLGKHFIFAQKKFKFD